MHCATGDRVRTPAAPAAAVAPPTPRARDADVALAGEEAHFVEFCATLSAMDLGAFATRAG